MIYVGSGEDRDQSSARSKAESFALQNLANDCSLIPEGTSVQPEHFEDTFGIIYRAFSKITISVEKCLEARKAWQASTIRILMNLKLEEQLVRYQKVYDPPEPEEASLLSAPSGIPDVAHFIVVRQQVALTKQTILSGSTNPSLQALQGVAGASRAISDFEHSHSQLRTEVQAFSNLRPNWFNHQPSAVRETTERRAQIQKEFPSTPTPRIMPSSGAGYGKGKGSRHHKSSPIGSDGPPPTN